MKATELRIGNYISEDRVSMKIEVIFSDRYSAVKLMTPQGTEIQAHIDLIKPILLTKEWLLKLGFKKKDNETVLDYETWWKDDNEFLFEADGRYYHSFIQTEKSKIKYVHQLQNLYFALTGEELIIKK